MRVSLGIGVMLFAVACSPAQRRTAGAGVMGLGLSTMCAGAVLVDPCSLRSRYDQRDCRQTTQPRYEAEGRSTLFVGAGVTSMGALVYVSGLRWRPPKPKPWPIR